MKKFNTVFTVITLTASLLVAMGCKNEPSAPTASPAAPTATGKHAAPSATPGSHEDWCAEHQVAESQCTRCNPTLIAAFKATGDWCNEHGLPESQCLKCNPDLKILRPPKAEGPK